MYVCVCRMVHVCEHIPTTPDILQCRAVRSEHTDRSVETMKSRKSPLRDVHETLSSLLYMADRAVQEPTLPPQSGVTSHTFSISHFSRIAVAGRDGIRNGKAKRKRMDGMSVNSVSQPVRVRANARAGVSGSFHRSEQ